MIIVWSLLEKNHRSSFDYFSVLVDHLPSMKLLFLVQKSQKAILDRLYEGVVANSDCDLRWLNGFEQDNLEKYFSGLREPLHYDRVLLFLRFKKEIRQVRFLRTIPNLAFLEHDAFQNYIPCKYSGKFSSHYRKLSWARIIVSGASVAQKLQDEGFDSVFVPKGFDEVLCKNCQRSRDIQFGFVGGLTNKLYSRRKEFLETLADHIPIFIGSSPPGEPYVELLNRIRVFVSADIGFGEYMIKNYEAMACGCLLVAYNQGDFENRTLGFRDMENVVLYRNMRELLDKIERLRYNPGLVDAIAAAGQAHVEKNYSFGMLGNKVVEALRSDLRPLEYRDPLWKGWFTRLFHAR